MTNKKFWLGMLAMVLAFGVLVIGCDKDGGVGDPIDVDLSLPAVQSLPEFTGTFVSTETEAQDLIADAVETLADLSGFLSPSANVAPSPSMSRSVYSEPFQEVINRQEIATGVYLTGFVDGYYKESFANDESPYTNRGDYDEVSYRIKMALDFVNAQQDGYTFNGKYTCDENGYQKAVAISHNPYTETITLRQNIASGYSLSVSKGGKGLKFVMSWKGNINLTFNYSFNWNGYDWYGYNPFEGKKIEDIIENFSFTVDVYDKDNVKQEEFSKTFTTVQDANEYLGTDIFEIMDR